MNEAELLFSHMLKCDRAGLYARRKLPLTKEEAAFASSVFRRRLEGEPLQYILGRADFFGLEFEVSRSVLIPRPETEILIEKALELGPYSRILDIGTGSGCIAVVLARHFKGAKVTAVDISRQALDTAARNALRHAAAIDFIRSDIFASLDAQPPFDLIISNPPYVASGDIPGLGAQIAFEPVSAIDGGSDGLDFYRRIAAGAAAHLAPAGLLAMEIGWNQAQEVAAIFRSYPEYAQIKVFKDYNDLDRVLTLRAKTTK